MCWTERHTAEKMASQPYFDPLSVSCEWESFLWLFHLFHPEAIFPLCNLFLLLFLSSCLCFIFLFFSRAFCLWVSFFPQSYVLAVQCFMFRLLIFFSLHSSFCILRWALEQKDITGRLHLDQVQVSGPVHWRSHDWSGCHLGDRPRRRIHLHLPQWIWQVFERMWLFKNKGHSNRDLRHQWRWTPGVRSRVCCRWFRSLLLRPLFFVWCHC